MIKFKRDKQTLIKISNKRLQEGDNIGAVSILHSDKPYSKENLDIYYHQALIYIKHENYNAAIDTLLLYVQLVNKSKKCKAYNALGYCFLKQKNYVLADSFFNLQLSISVKNRCDFDDEMYEYFYTSENKGKKEKFKVIIPYQKEFNEGLLNFELAEYDKALENFNQIPYGSKFYADCLGLKSKIFFCKNQNEKGLAYLREYFSQKKEVSAYTYYEFITILAERDMQEYNYYLHELETKANLESNAHLLLADMYFKYTSNYDLVINHLDLYEKDVKISPITLSLKGLAYLYKDNVVLAKDYLKKAYLYSNLSKYKFMLENTSKEQFLLYPNNLVKYYTNKITEEINNKKVKATYRDLKEIFEVAIDAENNSFWLTFIGYLSLINKKTANFYLKQVLIVPSSSIFVKIKAKQILAKNGYIGELIEFNNIPTTAKFIKLNHFKTEKFKQAFMGAYTAIFFLSNDASIEKAKVLEDKIIDYLEIFSENELSAFIICYLLNDGLKAKSYHELFNVTKKRILEMYKMVNIKFRHT